MNQKSAPVPVPHRLRESVIAGDGFVQRLREKGWSVAESRPIYTDPQIIRQTWLRCPNGADYADRAFYHLFGWTRFRRLLRAALIRTPCDNAAFVSLCPETAERNRYLAFLQDQAFLVKEGGLWRRGPRLFGVTDIGHTLEWYVAEWFRLTQSIHRLIPVRHGVTLHRGLDLGDIDVLALLDPWIITFECKTASTISTRELALFLQRARLVQPAIAVLLIDRPSGSLDGLVYRLNALLAKEHEDAVIPLSEGEGVYWGAKHICVTGVGEHLSHALYTVVRVIEHRGLP